MDEKLIELVKAAEVAVAEASTALKGMSQSSAEVAICAERLEKHRSEIYQEKSKLLYELYRTNCFLGHTTPMKMSEFLASGKLQVYRDAESVQRLLAYPYYWQACKELRDSISERLRDLRIRAEADSKEAPELVTKLAQLLNRASETANKITVATEK